MRGHGWRWILVLFHRYVGLSIAGFLIVAGLTGSVLTFEPELDAALNPELFEAPSSGRPPLSLDALIARVEGADPRVDVTAALLPLSSGESVMMRVAPAPGAPALGFDQIFVDPATGTVLGRRLWGTCCLARQNLIPFIYQLHLTLFLPPATGALLMGGVALAWLFDSLVGLKLAWPRRRTRGHGWRQALTVKRGSRGFRVWFDVHRMAGLWAFPLLIVLATTGVALNLRDEIAAPVLTLFSPLKAGVFDGDVAARPPATLNYSDAFQKARQVTGDEFERPTIVYAYHVAEFGVYGLAVTEPVGNPRNGLGPSWVYIDDRTGTVRDRDRMGRGSEADIFMQARLPLHSGRIAGDPGRVLVALLGLAVAILSATGVYIWWRKRRARVRHRLRD